MKVLDTEHPWVLKKLNEMDLKQKCAQLLHPNLFPGKAIDEIEKSFSDIAPGGLFIFSGNKNDYQEKTEWIRNRFDTPVVISSDLENGAGRMIKEATNFPDMMGIAAANDDDLMKTLSESTAREGRECGVHWTFGPVVDINVNPYNPITNTRSLGEDPDRIIRLAKVMINSLQEHQMAATIKHFPGDGYDDRDQHICTTVNPLNLDEWYQKSGRMFKGGIEAGAWTVMIGHIALPAYDPGSGASIVDAPPATISSKLTTNLLRKELGFQGLIVSDAMTMGGVTSWGRAEELVVKTIQAGCDMILFSRFKRDLQALLNAVENLELTEERIEESVKRVLALKVKLGLHEVQNKVKVSTEDKKRYERCNVEISEKSIQVVKDEYKVLPLKLKKGNKVLALHLRGDPLYHVDDLDQDLREKGLIVDSFTEDRIDEFPLGDALLDYHAILVFSVYGPTYGTNRIRWNGNFMRTMGAILSEHIRKFVVISFGSPYHLHEMPRLPCLINAYSINRQVQKSAMSYILEK